MGLATGFADQLQEVMVLNILDLVREQNKAAVNFVKRATLELVAELFATKTQRVTSGMLAQYQLGIGHADRLRCHDLVGQRILEYAILMNARFVSKCVAAGNGFVGLYGNSGDFAQQLAGGKKLAAHYTRVVGMQVRTNPHRHHNLFQGSISGTFADAVDSALNLTRSGGNGCQGVGHG